MSVLVGMLIAGLHRGRGRRAASRSRRSGSVGIFLSLATFAFALFFDSVMVKFTWVSGGNGITPLKTPRPLLGPIDFANEKSFLVLCIVDPHDRRAARRVGAGRHDRSLPRRAARQ